MYRVINTTRYIYCVLYERPMLRTKYLLHFDLLIFLELEAILPLNEGNRRRVGRYPFQINIIKRVRTSELFLHLNKKNI